MATNLYKKNSPAYITPEQLVTILASHKNLQDIIDVATQLRKSGSCTDMNYFETFFIQAKKII